MSKIESLLRKELDEDLLELSPDTYNGLSVVIGIQGLRYLRAIKDAVTRIDEVGVVTIPRET